MSDLTAKEQANAKAALRFLRTRFGGWKLLAKATRYSPAGLRNVVNGHRTPSPTLAFRIARVAQIGVDDVLAGKYPPAGVCPHCGMKKEGDDALAQ